MCITEFPLAKDVPHTDFSERMLDMVNSAGLAMMVSIGHRCGLFDVMRAIGATDGNTLARTAGLDSRYVREWLGAMTTGGIVHYDESNDTYRLPNEHAALLTRVAGSSNMASVTQFISVLGGVEDQIVDCFRHGGGVPYKAYPRFHEVMAEESHQTVVTALLDSILPLVEGLPEKLAAGIDVLDVGCGRGLALLELAASFPNSRFAGYDFSQETIDYAENQARRRGLMNIIFQVKDAATINESHGYDLITAFDAIHDQVKPDKVLQCISQALRPNGVFLMQDIQGSSHVQKNIDHPLAPLMYTISCMHCMTVSLSAGGAGLGAMWGREKALQMFDAAGFDTVRVEELSHDVLNYYYVAQRDASRRNGHARAASLV